MFSVLKNYIIRPLFALGRAVRNAGNLDKLEHRNCEVKDVAAVTENRLLSGAEARDWVGSISSDTPNYGHTSASHHSKLTQEEKLTRERCIISCCGSGGGGQGEGK